MPTMIKFEELERLAEEVLFDHDFQVHGLDRVVFEVRRDGANSVHDLCHKGHVILMPYPEMQAGMPDWMQKDFDFIGRMFDSKGFKDKKLRTLAWKKLKLDYVVIDLGDDFLILYAVMWLEVPNPSKWMKKPSFGPKKAFMAARDEISYIKGGCDD